MTIVNTKGKIVVDLTGPEGNAFALMALAKDIGRKIGYSREEINEMISDMMSSDYDHLVQVLDDHFGDFITIYTGE